MISLATEAYMTQKSKWPSEGRHILAQQNADEIVVYQAYRPSIGRFAAEHGYFGGDFNLSRMSWIKPNFLWMMYRCGWASKEDQEIVLAVTLSRTIFEAILREAVPSSFDSALYQTEKEWKSALSSSSVRLQWDPDHHPSGAKLARRAIQLGLRNDALRWYARDWIVRIEDITIFVHEQSRHVQAQDYDQLVTPCETELVLPPDLAARLGIGNKQ